MRIEAEVLADSLNSETGDRLTTLRIVLPKFILAEFNTHRMLSRNFSSSRAVPAKKMRSAVIKNPVVPVFWGINQKGMQSRSQLEGWRLHLAKTTWFYARYPACLFHWIGEAIGLHKQICNRIIEPWVWAEGVISATDWDNFFALRCHQDAQPEFKVLADAIKASIAASSPRHLKPGEWHFPFFNDRELMTLEASKKVSAARCARVSYYLKDGQHSNPEKDYELCDRLAGAMPMHLSPFEHQAVALPKSDRVGNLKGWRQYRKDLEVRQSLEQLVGGDRDGAI